MCVCVLCVARTPKCDGHAKVRWSCQDPMVTPKSDGMLLIWTPKSDGDGITFATSGHDNVVPTIQNQQDVSGRLSRRSIHIFLTKAGLKREQSEKIFSILSEVSKFTENCNRKVFTLFMVEDCKNENVHIVSK